MASFTVQLTPDVVNITTEGSLDTSVVGGVSIQRTMDSVFVVNGANEKMLYRLVDGEVYDDTTFATGTTEVDIGNPVFNAGTPVIDSDNVSVGHPTASSTSGSTF